MELLNSDVLNLIHDFSGVTENWKGIFSWDVVPAIRGELDWRNESLEIEEMLVEYTMDNLDYLSEDENSEDEFDEEEYENRFSAWLLQSDSEDSEDDEDGENGEDDDEDGENGEFYLE